MTPHIPEHMMGREERVVFPRPSLAVMAFSLEVRTMNKGLTDHSMPVLLLSLIHI